MKLRIWIPCILLIVILIMFCKTYYTEGFQVSGGAYTPPPAASSTQTRINFWSILSQDKAGLPITPIYASGSGSGSGSGSTSPMPGSGSGSGSSGPLLARVTDPGPTDTFTMVYPKYLSMYALAKYNFDPVAARSALINQYDALQTELQTAVETEQVGRARFAGDPQGESCAQINSMTMAFYGQLLSIYNSTRDLSGAVYTAAALHDENIKLQNSAGSANVCTNQGATPSAACVQLASMDEKLFPLLPTFDAMNKKLLTNGQDIQSIVDLLLQAYMGMGCIMPTLGSSAGPNINTVFSDTYLDSLPTADTDFLSSKLQELSPYYVSPNIINYISKSLIGTSDFNSDLSEPLDYLKDMNKVTNSIISLNTDIKAVEQGKFYSESGSYAGGFVNCPGGYYCPLTSSMPIQCPVGTYCPPGTTDKPLECPPGLYSPPGSADISKCTTAFPLGYYQDTKTGKLVKCSTGSYCVDGIIRACPAGTYNMKTGMSSISACIDCPKGSYCKTPTSITPCAAGKFNPLTKQIAETACTTCAAGTFCANKGTATATPCAAGTFSNATGLTGACSPIQPGYYLQGTGNTTDTGKLPCAAGYYCPGGTGYPVTCPPGSYCDVAQLTAAKECPAGRYGSTPGLITPNCSGPCAQGYICPPGSSVNNVIPCPAGMYCVTGSGSATSCPAGYYCAPGSIDATPCPSGTYSILTGQTSISACNPCPPGKLCNEGTANMGSPCPAGYYCTGGIGVNPCIAGGYCDETSLQAPKLCPIGTYNPNTGSASIKDCKPCAPGTWSVSVGEQGSCSQTCPPGSHCPSPNSMMSYTIPPSAAPVYTGAVNGKITIPLGTINPVTCPVGTYCTSAGMSVPTPCAPGTYSSATGQTSSLTCVPCEPGKYCPTPGAGSQLICPPGTYCPIQGGSSPNQCPIGNICPIPGLQAGYPCPPGQLCNTLGEGSTPNAQCPAGTYSSGGAGSSCTPCDPGYYGVGASTTGQCSGLCPAGYYCPSGSSPVSGSTARSPPVPCPLGYYCPAGTGTVCGSGQYFSNGRCMTCSSSQSSGSSGSSSVCFPCNSTSTRQCV